MKQNEGSLDLHVLVCVLGGGGVLSNCWTTNKTRLFFYVACLCSCTIVYDLSVLILFNIFLNIFITNMHSHIIIGYRLLSTFIKLTSHS